MALADLWLVIALLAVAAPLAAALAGRRAKTRNEPQKEVEKRPRRRLVEASRGAGRSCRPVSLRSVINDFLYLRRIREVPEGPPFRN